MKYLFLSIALLICNIAFSQAPTKKDIDNIINQVNKGMSKMSPEDKRRMDSMGIKTPAVDMRKGAGITDKQLQEAYENEQRTVPRKDITRIARISTVPLNSSSVLAFIQSTQTKVLTKIKPASKSAAEEIYQAIKNEYAQSNATGNVAMELWMLGRIEPALYIIGKACQDDPTNANNLNNYAAMLSMMGAEQLAIPLLNFVNKQFPRNSTILNNIGQAWFGLGNISEASAYLDMVTAIYPQHPQACFTKALIQKEKGDTKGAIEEIRKAIEGGYTNDKSDELRKLGIKTFDNERALPTVSKPDAMGLKKFVYPSFPRSSEASIVFDKEWATFKSQCEERIKALEPRIRSAEQIAAAANEKRKKELMASIQRFNASSGNFQLPLPFYSETAIKQFNKLTIDFANEGQQKSKKLGGYKQEMHDRTEAYRKQMEKLAVEDLQQSGEGMPNRSFCPQKKAATDAYLADYNSGLQERWDNYLRAHRQYMNKSIYLMQYMYWPEDFEEAKLRMQIGWLKKLIEYSGVESIPMCPSSKAPAVAKFGKLPQFDDIHCEYHNVIRILLTTFYTDCSRLTTEFDSKFFKFKLKENLNKKDFGDQFMGCTVEVAAEVSANVKAGPLKAETKVIAGVAAEFDRRGLKDLFVKAGVKAGAGTNIIGEAGKEAGMEPKVLGVGASDLTISVGAKGQISLISGKGAVTGTGTLSGLNK